MPAHGMEAKQMVTIPGLRRTPLATTLNTFFHPLIALPPLCVSVSVFVTVSLAYSDINYPVTGCPPQRAPFQFEYWRGAVLQSGIVSRAKIRETGDMYPL